LIETVNSVTEARVALEAANEVGLPCWMAFAPTEDGKLFTGETLAQAEAALEPLGVDAILVNCAPPDDCRAGLVELGTGRPGPKGLYRHGGRFDPAEWLFTDEYPPDRYADEARAWQGLGATVIGGCCGTTPDTIAAVAKALKG